MIEIKKLFIKSKEEVLVDISFKIKTSCALIGQSGSGKSLSLKAILDLLPSSLVLQKDISCSFDLKKEDIALIPQNPFSSLSPMTKISKQFFCTQEEKLESLKLVGLDEFVLNRFPIQLSGGQLQRVVIAIIIAKKPKLLLLDEPTTALDNESKNTILELLKDLQIKLEIFTLFVTHDINSIKSICEDIVIIKDGKVIEEGKTKEVLQNPSTQYTKELINSNFSNKEFRK